MYYIPMSSHNRPTVLVPCLRIATKLHSGITYSGPFIPAIQCGYYPDISEPNLSATISYMLCRIYNPYFMLLFSLVLAVRCLSANRSVSHATVLILIMEFSPLLNRPDRTIETFNYLRLEYDKVAWAATIADQNLAAIYYGELWATAQNGGVPPSSPEATTHLNGGENVQSILRKVSTIYQIKYILVSYIFGSNVKLLATKT